MSLRDDDRVSAVAVVVESEGSTAAPVAEAAARRPVEVSADAGDTVPPELSGSDGASPEDT
jgi:hypothetical protein